MSHGKKSSRNSDLRLVSDQSFFFSNKITSIVFGISKKNCKRNIDNVSEYFYP